MTSLLAFRVVDVFDDVELVGRGRIDQIWLPDSAWTRTDVAGNGPAEAGRTLLGIPGRDGVGLELGLARL